MNRLYLPLGIGAAVLALAGCEPKKPEYVVATVTQERGSVAREMESSGALLGNECARISDPTYILQLQTPQGSYIVSVLERNQRPLEGLALAIEEGSRVRIEKKDLDNPSNFPEDKIGHLYSDEIIVL